MESEAAAVRAVFLSELPASPRERRFARTAVLASLGIFLLAAPFARTKLIEVWPFIPSYQSALMIIDLITAVLMFTQFVILGTPELLVLAGGYCFTALMAVPHALSFPRLFAPQGLMGGGPQTTAWLYMIWHAGFPLSVIGYMLLRDVRSVRQRGRAVAMTCAVVLAAVGGAVLLTTVGHGMLPTIMRGDGYTPGQIAVTAGVWSLSLAALLALWRRRRHSVLDLWLVVVMWAWLLDIGLSAVINAGRFDVGFYAGRVYGLAAASLVLVVLLIKSGAVYSRLALSFAAERDAHDRQLREVQSELIHVARLTELGQLVSALAHEVNQPLTAAGSYVGAGRRLVAAGETAKADEALRKAVEQVSRASQVIQRLRQYMKKEDGERKAADVRQTIETALALALPDAEQGSMALEIDIRPDLPPVHIDEVQVQQVLLNLFRNAVEAMRSTPRRELIVRAVRSGHAMVDVSVTDSGPSLAPDIRAKLFQPFVTTKRDGMGVGLSICRGIVEAHGGRMWFVDDRGGGAAFHFTLPVAGGNTASPARMVATARA